MKKITFRRDFDGKYVTNEMNGEWQDKYTYLKDLAESGLMFRMLLNCKYFKAKIGNSIVRGYTDKYGNKILQYD